MRKLILLFFLLALPASLWAQVSPQIQGSGAPTNPCANGGQQYFDQTNRILYACPSSGSNWANIGLGNTTGFPSGDLTITGNLLFSPTDTYWLGGSDALHTPYRAAIGNNLAGELLIAPIQDGSAAQAQGVLNAQNGYFLIKAEAPFGSAAWEPGIQEIGSNGGTHGQVYITFGGGFNGSAASDATSSILMSNTSSGTETDFEIINTQGVGIEQHLNQGTWNGNTGAASQANKTGGTCAMVAGTTCTFSLTAAFTATPICIVTAQGTNVTGGAAACSVSSTTVTITSASSNSNTWGALLIGNPN